MPEPADKLWWYRTAPREPLVSHDRLRSIRRERTRDALACLALSALCFSQARSETLFLAGWDFYSRVPLGAPTLLALVLNIFALTAVGVLGVQAIRHVRRPAWRRLAAVAAAATLLISLNYARITYETVDRWTNAIGRPGLLALVVLMLAASLRWPRPALRAIRGFALLVSPLALLTLAHALWMCVELAGGPVWRGPADLLTFTHLREDLLGQHVQLVEHEALRHARPLHAHDQVVDAGRAVQPENRVGDWFCPHC